VIQDSKERLRLWQKKRKTETREIARKSLEIEEISKRRDHHKLYDIEDGVTLLRDLIQGDMYKEANDLMNISASDSVDNILALEQYILERKSQIYDDGDEYYDENQQFN